LANLVATPLKGRNPPGHERANEVIRCGEASLVHLADELVDQVGLSVGITRVIGPVMLGWSSFYIRRKVDEVLTADILNIEKSFLPLAA
jgi:hypothetical protein